MHKKPDPWMARRNRRGCFVITAVIVLLIAALAFIGFRADPTNALDTDIPVLG
jgi:hypothetical protein